MDVKWTQNQKNAIFAKGNNILISAAAGSGKTAVLVERVIQLLIDEKNPIDANKLLIVTFTNAAAEEMKERISSEISNLLLKYPNNTHLQRQQILLSQAHISTIHSFCNNLIHENFYKLNISPDFRIADNNELSILIDSAIDNTLEKKFKENKNVFIDLVETFSNGKNDNNLVQTIKTIYNFITSHPYPEEWLESKINLYKQNNNIEKTKWGQVILSYAHDAINYCIEITEKSIKLSRIDEKLFSNFNKVLLSDLYFLKNLLSSDWDKLNRFFKNPKFETLRAPRGYTENPIKIKVSNNRAKIKKIIEKLKKFFSLDTKICENDLKILCPIINELFSVIKDFKHEFEKLKYEKNILDFSDLEHLTIKILESEDLSENFDEIMVDEYQDTNQTQDLIFKLLSKNEKNLFVVGDVKQSIYGFRQAMPEIFIKRKNNCALLKSLKITSPSKIILEKNFRSQPSIINSINYLFEKIMSDKLGGIEYNEEEKLVPTQENSKGKTSLHIIDISESEQKNFNIIEAEHISNIIQDKIKNENRSYKDFCILLRSANVHSKDFSETLKKHNIPTWTDSSSNFFNTIEISSIISLLKIIDNPIQDIPLLSVLMSPMYAFSPDDISDLKLKNNNSSLYYALKKSIDNKEEKFVNFVKDINYYRYLASTLKCSDLISKILDKSGFSSIISTMENGDLKISNLRMLIEHAKSYEKTGDKDLSGFIRFIEKIEQQKLDLPSSHTVSESANAVKIMSIHRSKGLEFPVCIISNCSRKFNNDKRDILIHKDLGLGIKIKEKEHNALLSNFIRDAVSLELEKDSVSEELRILYVAMTRAKEELIMISSLKNPEKYLDNFEDFKSQFNSFKIRTSSSFSDWILLCSSSQKITPWNIEFIKYKEKDLIQNNIKIQKNFSNISSDFLNKLHQKFLFKYKNQDIINIPSKISVSELASQKINNNKIILSRPSFMSDKNMTPAEKGTALHTFVQFADFNLASQNVKKEIKRLISKKFITQQQADVIEIDKLENFFKSKLMTRILNSSKILKEFRFTININVKDLNLKIKENFEYEHIILQGAIDCAFKENDKLIIIDYKTDHINSLDKFKEKYKEQLLLYKKALEECTKTKVSKCLIYSFHLNDYIDV